MGALALKLWRKEHVKTKKCLDCTEDAEEGKKRCKRHLKYQATLAQEKRNNTKCITA